MTARDPGPGWISDDSDAARVRAQVIGVLAAHGLEATPADIVDALATGVAYAKRRDRGMDRLRAREVRSAESNAERMRRYRAAHPPPASTLALLRESLNVTTRRRVRGATPEPEPVTRARRKLIDLLDGLHFVTRTAASTGENIAPILARLRTGAETETDLVALLGALRALPPLPAGRQELPRNTAIGSLVRGGVMAWEACGRRGRYSYDPNSRREKPALTGPLVDFLRALLDLAGLQPPGWSADEVLHNMLRQFAEPEKKA